MRAPVLWYGGKGNLVSKLIPLLPRRGVQTFVDAYGGAGSVILNVKPYPVEVYNDLDAALVNLFRVLQDDDLRAKLHRRLSYTLYARAEYWRALALRDRWDELDEVTRAWAFFTAQNQGFSGKHWRKDNGWSYAIGLSRRGRAHIVNSWQMRLGVFDAWGERLARMQIEQRDALDCMRNYDSPQTLIYADPPYQMDTRSGGENYAHEMGADQHGALIDTLLNLQGAAVLSGYEHPEYRRLDAAGWGRVEIKTASYAAGKTRESGLQGKGSALAKVPRTEVIWINPLAGRLLNGGQMSMFADGASRK